MVCMAGVKTLHETCQRDMHRLNIYVYKQCRGKTAIINQCSAAPRGWLLHCQGPGLAISLFLP